MKTKLAASLAAFILLSLLCAATALAVPPCPGGNTLEQPDGSEISATLHGDEWFHWYEAGDGSVLVRGGDGAWRYAHYKDGKLAALSARYGLDARPSGALDARSLCAAMKKNPPAAQGEAMRDEAARTAGLTAPTGPGNLLVILVSFSDFAIRGSDHYWSDAMFADYSDHITKSAYSSSVNDYYREVSGGKFYFNKAREADGTANDGIVSVKLNLLHPTFGGDWQTDSRDVAELALYGADSAVDFSLYDKNGDGTVSPNELHIVLVLAGYEQSYDGNETQSVWSHVYGLDTPVRLDGVRVGLSYAEHGELHGNIDISHCATIGVFVQGLACEMGLPNLYGDSKNTDSLGAGIFSLMAYGCWAYYYPYDDEGSSPTHPDAWSKCMLGFVEPVVSASGNYALNAAASGRYNVIKIPTGDPKQYFLVENRYTTAGYDASLSRYCTSGGIAIWHIDENVLDACRDSTGGWYGVNADENHKAVDLEEADEGILGYSALDSGKYPWDMSSGKYDGLFRTGSAGCASVFNGGTNPSSRLTGGGLSGAAVTVLSPAGGTMNVALLPRITSLAPDHPSPQKQYRAVRWTGRADGTGLSYQFDVYRGSARTGGTDGYSRQNWFDWTPATPGAYTVAVSVLTDGIPDASVKSVAYVVEADTTPPQIKAMAGGSQLAGFALTNRDVSATALDPEGGSVASESYAVNGGGAVPSWPAAFTAEGDYVLSAADQAGNAATFAFAIDRTAPSIAASFGSAALAYGMTVTSDVSVTVSDPHPGSFSATKDGAPVPWPAGGVFHGAGVYGVSAVDGAGNASAFRFGILPYGDMLEVASSALYVPDDDAVEGDVTVRLKGEGWSVTVNGSEPWRDAAPRTFTEEGLYTATASSGAAGGGSVTMRFAIDRSKPAIAAVNAAGSRVYPGSMHDSAVTVTVADLTAVRLTVTKNGAAMPWPAGGKFALDGSYALSAVDAAGHTASFAFAVDVSAPVIRANAGGAPVAKNGYSRANTTVTVTDVSACLKTATRNGAAIAWPADGVFAAEGVYTVSAADNYMRVSAFSFTIDRTPPVISAKQSNGAKAVSGGTYAKPVVLSVGDIYLLSKSATKNGAALAWPPGGRFAAKGTYVITAKDRAGNLATFQFTIK